ncbi:unnamed protein product [Rotaria sp. Silwood2]|nr:unnamed protein product [Rotaria sp. Silwood2]CAF2502158.1 unnamed protein product [Rotaria sp. Silwood2]CAF2816316.1 unnamed protein product [Rotaria sp. Silwood2]CAF2965179.1 unnamed protein product [Rotaria sp. Silwood2]CAF3867660.1 unnamed protein product [Rotaria sp. Silwood2]
MKNKELSNNTGYVTAVKILDIEKRYKPGPKHYVYVIQVTWSNPENLFIIYRRYAQFFDLQCKLLDLFAETPLESNNNTQIRRIPYLPGKIILGRSQIRQIALERKQTLNEYCQKLILLPERISRSRPIIEFFHPLITDVQKPIESIMNENKLLRKSSVVISEPSKLAKYRCLEDFNATDKLEMSLKQNEIVEVLQKHENGWWFVQNNDRTGFVPGTYLEPSELEYDIHGSETSDKSLNKTYVVNERYEGKSSDELSLDQGSFVIVIEKSFTGWWIVKFNNTTGKFPAIYLSSCEGMHTSENGTNDASNVTSKIQKSDNFNDSDWDDDEEYHRKLSNDTKLELYYAHSNFIDDIEGCLSFQRGDLIEIHTKHSSEWWFGRRMTDGHVLTWFPANYLQKEPILDTIINNINYESFNSDHSDSSINKQQQQEKEKLSTDVIYQNFESQGSSDVIYSEVIKNQQTIETTNTHKESSISISVPPMNDNQESTPKSVKDIVKKFNQRLV